MFNCEPNKSRSITTLSQSEYGSKLKYLEICIYSHESFFLRAIHQSCLIIEMMIQKNLEDLEKMDVLIIFHAKWFFGNKYYSYIHNGKKVSR